MNERDINLKLVQLKRQSRERYLELLGIDPKKVLQLEQEIYGQYDELASGVRDMLKNAGKEVAEQQQRSLGFMQDKRLKMAKAKVWPWWEDPCTSDARFFSHGEPMTEPGTVSYEEAGNIVHLLVDTGPADSPKEIEAEYRFILDLPDIPFFSRHYCVCPVIQMNGHWLTWTWGTGPCGGPTMLGSADAWVNLKVEVYQGGLLKRERSCSVLPELGDPEPTPHVTNGDDAQSGFYYDSETDGGASLTVKLEPATDATVVVKCIAKVKVLDAGRAWIDMSTSPQFYFKVPEVHWGLSPFQQWEDLPVAVAAGRYRVPYR